MCAGASIHYSGAGSISGAVPRAVQPGRDTGDAEGKELTAAGWHSSRRPALKLKQQSISFKERHTEARGPFVFGKQEH